MRYRTRRVPTRCDAITELQEELRRVRVADVSAGGARLAEIGRIAPGASCAIRVLGDVLTARVRWSDGESAGIAFDAALTPRQFDTLRQAPVHRSPGRAPRRTFSFAEMR